MRKLQVSIFFSSFLCIYSSLVINLGITDYSSVSKDLGVATCLVRKRAWYLDLFWCHELFGIMNRSAVTNIRYHDRFWFHDLFSITICSDVTNSCESRTILVSLSILVSQTRLVSQTLWCFCELCGSANLFEAGSHLLVSLTL